MKREWTTDEIIEHFTLLEDEQEFITANAPYNRLGKALLLKFFQYEARFPEDRSEIPPQVIDYIAQQLDIAPIVFEDYQWQGRSIKAHRTAIRERYEFRPATLGDQDELRAWLLDEILPDEHRPLYLEEQVYARLREHHIEPPSKGRVKRLVASAVSRYEKSFFAQTVERLSPEVKRGLYDLIQHSEALDDDLSLDPDEILQYPLHELKVGAGNAKVKNIKRVCARLKQLQAIGLPDNLFEGLPQGLCKVRGLKK